MGGIEGLPLQLMIVILVATMGTAIIVGWMGNIDTPQSIGDVECDQYVKANGNIIESLVITVTDQDGNRLEGALVVLRGMSVSSDGDTAYATTDSDGKATFSKLTISPLKQGSTGTIHVDVSKNGYSGSRTYDILVIT